MLKTNDFNGDGYRTFIEQFPGQKMKTFSFVPIISEKIASNETSFYMITASILKGLRWGILGNTVFASLLIPSLDNS